MLQEHLSSSLNAFNLPFLNTKLQEQQRAFYRIPLQRRTLRTLQSKSRPSKALSLDLRHKKFSYFKQNSSKQKKMECLDQDHTAVLSLVEKVSRARKKKKMFQNLFGTYPGLPTPKAPVHQSYLANWANVADKICFGRT